MASKKSAFTGAAEIRKHARNYGFSDGIGEGGTGQKGKYVRKKAEDFFKHDSGVKGMKNVTEGFNKRRAFELAKKYAKQRGK